MIEAVAAALLAAAPAKAEFRPFVPRGITVVRPATYDCTLTGPTGIKTSCHHLVVSYSDRGLNYHFDDEDEQSGVSFIVKAVDGSHKHGATLQGDGIMLRASGEKALTFPAAVSCFRSPEGMFDAVRCEAKVSEGGGVVKVAGTARLSP